MKLNELIPMYFLSGAIFTKMDSMFTLPFKNDVSIPALDIDFMNTYGERETSPLVDNFLKLNFDYVVDPDGHYVFTPKNNKVIYLDSSMQSVLGGLSQIIWQRYNVQWSKLWDTMKLKYNPIHNYNMVENEHSENSISSTSQSKQSTEANLENTNENSNYGFNSTTPSPTTKNVTTTIGSKDENFTDINSSNNEDTNNDRELRRAGNIGVTTSQKMISDERDVWMYDYFKIIFKQVADLITCKMYF